MAEVPKIIKGMGEKRLFRTVTQQILPFMLWVMDLIKEKTSLL